MIQYKKKFLFLQIGETWYTYKAGLMESLLPNAWLHVKKLESPVRLSKQDLSYTIENDLKKDKETILNGYTKSVRQQISQAREAGINCHFTKDIDRFVDFYNEFASRLGIPGTSRQRVTELGDQVMLSVASKDDQWLAAHLITLDSENGILRVSHSSSKRIDEQFDKHFIGKANKLLHYFEMMHFKDQGYTTYDFGGYTKDPVDKGLAGINNFKLQFGGDVVECRNYYTYSYMMLRSLGKMTGMVGGS